MLDGFTLAALIFVVFVVVILYSTIKTVPQGYNWTIERLWSLHSHLNARTEFSLAVY